MDLIWLRIAVNEGLWRGSCCQHRCMRSRSGCTAKAGGGEDDVRSVAMDRILEGVRAYQWTVGRDGRPHTLVDAIGDLHGLHSVEGRRPRHNLPHYDAKAVDIGRLSVAFVPQHLWGGAKM